MSNKNKLRKGPKLTPDQAIPRPTSALAAMIDKSCGITESNYLAHDALMANRVKFTPAGARREET